MSRFNFRPTALTGLTVVERRRLEDSRGFFSRLYCADELAAAGLPMPIVQINHSFTAQRGTVRGLHFQHPPHAEDKFVSCLHGEVFDVAVDLRRGSSTFLKWHGERLSAANATSLLIPKGFAHGFQALSDECELIYLVSAAYAPAAEGALHAADPAIGIAWPLPCTGLSPRDAGQPFVTRAFEGI
jgi:dTDP-4-dehydrorhamnose 3,5-epimerase